MENTNIIGIYPVLSINDDLGGGRIKVMMDNDKDKPLENIPYAFPLIPKLFHSIPKVGESVLILTSNIGNSAGQRYYIGPVISQNQNMGNDPNLLSSKSLIEGGAGKPLPNINMYADVDGCFPEKNDVAVIGRRKSDIIEKDNEIHIRCGAKLPTNEKNKKYQFNKKDPAFIQLAHYDVSKSYKNKKTNKTVEYKSVANFVADKINIISHDSSINFDTNKTKKLIDEETLMCIFEEAHQLPYGDVLVDFLKLFLKAFKTHTHPYSGLPPIVDDTIIAVDKYNMDEMLSDSIRIN